MANEEKVIELACNKCACGYNIEEKKKCGHFIPVFEMAQWKDEQEIQFLQSLLFQSATQNIFNRINERIKLLKGELSHENDKV